MKVTWALWAATLWALAKAAPTPQQFNAELVAEEGIPAGHRVTSITHAEPLSQIISQAPDANQPFNLDDILRQLTGDGSSIVSADFVQGPSNPSFGSRNSVTTTFTNVQQNQINRQGFIGSDEEQLPLPDSRELNFDDSVESDDIRIVNVGPGFSSPGVTFGGQDLGGGVGGSVGVTLSTFDVSGGSVGVGGAGGLGDTFSTFDVSGGSVGDGGAGGLGVPFSTFDVSGGSVGGGGVDFGGQLSLSSASGSAVSSGPGDSYFPPPLTLATPSSDYLQPPSTSVTATTRVVTAPAQPVVVLSAKPTVVTSSLPVVTKPVITLPPKPIVQLPAKPTITTTFAKPQIPALNTNALGALLGGLATKAINPTQTLGSLLRGLNGQNGIVVVDLNSREDNVRLDTDDSLDNFGLDIDSLEDDSFSLSSGVGSTLSFDSPTTTAVTATTKSPLGPKFLFQGPLSDILLTKGQWLGTLIGGLVDIGGTVVRSFNKTPLF